MPAATPLFRARGFGLDWQADTALDQFDPLPATTSQADVHVTRVDQLAERGTPRKFKRGAIYPDGFRIGWDDEAVFDMFGGTRIDYCPQSAWHGSLPAPFFSTVAALTLGWRGLLPLHVSAIEIGGKAILIGGAAGAGKSTLAAELLSAGAQLISDDLSVLSRPGDASPPLAYRGRQSIRLYPRTATGVAASRLEGVPDDPRGKVLVWPERRTTHDAIPVGGLILLGTSAGPVSALELVPVLPKLLFRPAWMESIPVYAQNRAALLGFARTLPAYRLPRVSGFSPDDRARRIDSALAAISALLR